jgi:hypothetical protein
LPWDSQQGGDEYGLCCWTQESVSRRCSSSKVLSQIDAEFRQEQLVAGDDERHLLRDQMPPLVRSQRFSDVDDWVSRNRPDLVEVSACVREARLALLVIDGQQ